ncbi:hypothetical protein [Streptomyces sp. AK02-01A]|uniref:hypothetical protein n=1 Tax=Streptomyces sp. AK02-01A TaxID=3028648 RepID=UPI0029A11E1A|nr:hypothetical protein [Streptomyces sp. AK02-01A]MDX3852250.1 hypothetical protein [Streptomyces sp. AK02-01A]
MTMHHPGLPQDLPSPELLWARWAAIAVVTANEERESDRDPTGYWLDDEGLHFNDAGASWWTLIRTEDGRALLFGEDESGGVKWHEPPVDLFEGAPEWLPHDRLQYLLEGYELGCVYWYEDGAWARAPYPDGLRDDGLDGGMGRFGSRERAADELDACLDSEIDFERVMDLITHAEQGTLTGGLLETLVAESDWADSDPHAMAEALRRSRLDEGGTGQEF